MPLLAKSIAQKIGEGFSSWTKGHNSKLDNVGVLFEIDGFEYFAPLSSPKPKHKNMKNTVDFFKIKGGELGAINFNNMIPVNIENYVLIDLNKETTLANEQKYLKLLKEQLNWLNANYAQVKNKSLKLYQLYNMNKLSKNIMDRCCNFQLLEEKSKIYIKNTNK